MGRDIIRFTVKGKSNKRFVRDMFIHKRTFQLKINSLFEVEMFVCSKEALNLESVCYGVYMIQVSSNHASMALNTMLGDHLEVHEECDYDFATEGEREYDSLFDSGFLVWCN